MSWVLTASRDSSPPFAKWLDIEAAERWRGIMRYYLDHDASEWARVGGDEAAQWRKVAEYFAALRGFALACDLHPCDLAWYGPRRQKGDPGTNDVPGLFTDAAIWNAPYRRAVVDTLNRYSSGYREMLARARAGDRADLDLTIQLRVDLDASGAVVVRNGPLPDPPSGADRFGVDDAATGGVRSSWASTAWVEGDADAGRLEVNVFCPLAWSYDLARAAMEDCVRFSVLASVARSLAWIGTRNAKLAQLFGGDGTPAEVVELARSWDLAAVTAVEPPTAWRAAIGGMGTLAAAALASGVAAPVAALTTVAVGILFGVPELLNRFFSAVFGVAVARGYDCWGRAQPYLARQDYTGSLNPRTEPTHAIPAVPFWIVGTNPIGLDADRPLVELREVGQDVRDGSGGGGGGGGALVALGLLGAWLISRKRRA